MGVVEVLHLLVRQRKGPLLIVQTVHHRLDRTHCLRNQLVGVVVLGHAAVRIAEIALAPTPNTKHVSFADNFRVAPK